VTGPDDPQPYPSDESGSTQPSPQPQQSWQSQPGWQPQPSWEPQHSWDQPPITEITPPTGAEEPAADPTAHQPGGYPSGPDWSSPQPAGQYYPSGQFGTEDYSTGGYPPAGPAAGYPGAGYPPAGPAAGYPDAGYPDAGYPVAGYPGAEPAHRPRRKLSWILGAAVAVLLLVTGGGAFAAYQVLNGGGTQPDQVVPADAMAFLKLDLNPSASQKLAAARFLHRIPKLGSGFGGSSDWRKAVFDALSSSDSLPLGVSYDRDVKPWLGKRAGVAFLPKLKDGSPEMLLVLQSTDDAKARAGIARFGPDNGVNFYRGYAVVAETKQIADEAVASAKAANLAGSAHYSADMKQLGSLGVSSGWADLGAAFKLAGTTNGLNMATAGRLAYTVRLTADSADLVGKFYGLTSNGTPVANPDLSGLPVGTAIAAGIGTSPAAIDRAWKSYEGLLGQMGGAFSDPTQSGLATPDPSELIDSLQQEFGIRLPEDLKTLVGTGVTVAVATDGFNGDVPKFALQSRTNGPAAVVVLDRIRQAVEMQGADFPVEYRTTSNGLIVGNDPDYLAAVTASSGAKLSSLAGFRQSLPDRAGAQYTAFVNLDAIASSMRAGGASQDDLQAISAFSAAGLTVRTSGTTASLHIRLLAH
jgi:Protein of unknown function (DUF3352)